MARLFNTCSRKEMNALFWVLVHVAAVSGFSSEPPTTDCLSGDVSSIPHNSIPEGVTVPVTSADKYPLIFKAPPTCSRKNCRVFVGIERNAGNQDYLNFYIEGDAGAWVAVGFTSTPNMFSADVLACNLNPDTNMIEVLDTWNVAREDGRKNINDDVIDTFLFSGASNDGRITCRFGRSINGTGNTGNTPNVNLDGDYYVIYGRRKGSPTADKLENHLGNEKPSVSAGLVNILNETGVQPGGSFDSVKNGLVRAHGILMLIAWPLLASTAIYFASNMRGSLPNGEWFQIHRAFMIASLFLTALGFVFIFISQAHNSTPGLSDLGSTDTITRTTTAHFSIGILVMCLQIINPLIAICRCKPGEKYRWIFNLIHGFPGVGFIAIVAALTNVALGLSIFSSRYSRFDNYGIVWAYLGFIGYVIGSMVVTHIIRAVYMCKKSIQFCDDSEEKAKLVNNDVSGGEDHSCGYWIGCGIFVGYSLLLVLAISVIVALPRAN